MIPRDAVRPQVFFLNATDVETSEPLYFVVTLGNVDKSSILVVIRQRTSEINFHRWLGWLKKKCIDDISI